MQLNRVLRKQCIICVALCVVYTRAPSWQTQHSYRAMVTGAIRCYICWHCGSAYCIAVSNK